MKAKWVLIKLTCAGILHCMLSILCSQPSGMSAVCHMLSIHQCATCNLTELAPVESQICLACTACFFDGLSLRYMFPRVHWSAEPGRFYYNKQLCQVVLMLKQCIELLQIVLCREAVTAMMQQNDILFHRLQNRTHLYCMWCREAVKAMMQQNDIPFHENRLQAVGLAEVYTRLCGNLINIYSHSRNTSKQRILLDMLLAISPNNIEYSIRHAQVVTKAARHAAWYQHGCLHACWAGPGHIPSSTCCL